jgi:UDP-galactopyranose mutase
MSQFEYPPRQLLQVSTEIADVAGPYGPVVAIARDTAAFLAACEAALRMRSGRRAAMRAVMRAAMRAVMRAVMRAAMRAIVAATSWDVTVDAMRRLLTETAPGRASARSGGAGAGISASAAGVAQGSAAGMAQGSATSGIAASAAGKGVNAAGASAAGKGANAIAAIAASCATVNPPRPQGGVQHARTLIVGAGPTGLSAAFHLDEDALLLDKNSSVGGWCRSIHDQGFTFDHAGHSMFSNDPYVLSLYDMLLGPNLHWQQRDAWVYSKRVYTRYPFQGALHGLPPKVIAECIIGAVEARFGSIDAAALHALDPVDDCCADGTLELASGKACIVARKRASQDVEEFIYQVWGRGIAEHFAIPNNKKLWTVPLDEMETSWLGGRVALPDLREIIEGALEPLARPMGPNARFAYPLSGGFQALMSGFLPHIKGKIEMNAEAAQLLPREHVLVMSDGRRYRYEHLISTMPLPELIKLIGSDAPADVRAASGGLRHLSVRCVNLGVARENITDKHWIYYPEETLFHRIFVQGNASPHCNPPGGFGLSCEISYSPCKPLPLDGQALIDRCIDDCVKVGMLRPEDRLITTHMVDLPYAYLVYDHARAANVALVKAWLARYDILLAGRYSEWEYYNSDHAFIAGKKAAQAVLRQRADAANNVGAE